MRKISLSNDLNSSEDYILENSNESIDLSESLIEDKFKFGLSFWSEKKLKLLLKEEYEIFSKNLINSKLK